MNRVLTTLVMGILIFVCSEQGIGQYELKEAFPNLSFTRPVDLQDAGDGSDRIFVVEQQGNIYVFPNDSNVTQKSLFLDLTAKVDDSGNEMGLLGLAFHPQYESNGYFYVDYTTSDPSRRSVVSRFTVSAENENMADPQSEVEILSVNQPESNHNGGQIVFGPDGYLYISLGDGGGAGDDHGEIGNGQDRKTLLGSILRIDVDRQQGDLNYAIPEDNPFVGNQEDWQEEIYAYGLRNVWRFSFDFQTGWLWAGDVGQNEYEEVDIIQKGLNYGWRIMEGKHCYDPPAGCDTTGLELPVWEYDHSVGQSITGGYVYHGDDVPELTGLYIYADYVGGQIWSLNYDGQGEPENSLLLDTGHNISSFGQDQNDELYICTFDGDNSKIYKFKSTVSSVNEENNLMHPQSFKLKPNYPNPFNGFTKIPYMVSQAAHVQIDIYNVSGKHIRQLVNTRKVAGAYSATWQADDVPSGIYFYRFTADQTIVTTRQMLLIK
ncbi:MAG: T9SS type A sorting domain-containing protein [Caldithrix sp.]|nr:T9SS type A sorting domain-containing protein [Caldithrix sp.]